MNDSHARASKPSAAVIGAGPAGLMAAETLALRGASVSIHDRMPSPARKFLLAGRGGLNITHSEQFEAFVARYGAAAERLRPCLESFPPQALRDWCAELGEETFVGSSGRVFPKSFKASPLLRAWLRRLDGLGVSLHPRETFEGFDAAGNPVLRGPGAEARAVEADATIFALGGASWPRLGSDASWAPAFEALGVAVAPLRPANCGFEIAWSATMRGKFAGAPLKNVRLHFEGASARGEAVIAETGLEGGAVYALSAPLREAIAARGCAMLRIDLRPDVEEQALAARLARAKSGDSLANILRKAAGLTPAAAALVREAGPPPREPAALAALVKGVALRLVAPRPIARAISSAGGIPWVEISEDFSLARNPRVFVAGEMLDWEAPTGGYLLQACFATGRAAGEGAARRLGL